MKNVVRRMASILFFPLFIWAKIFNGLVKGKVITLILHDLSETDIVRFKRIVTFLNKYFRFITPHEFEQMSRTGRIPKGISFLITFDDGFKSSKIAAEQVLDPLRIKAAFFCCGSFIDMDEDEGNQFVAERIYQKTRKPSDIKRQEQAMTKSDLQQLIVSGHVVGCHTDTHPIISDINNYTDLALEFIHSKAKLEQITGTEITWFAYPFGRIDCVNAFSLNCVKKHYKLCFSGVGGATNVNHPYALFRVSLILQDPYLLQLSLVLGAASAFYWNQRRKLISYCQSDPNNLKATSF